MNDPMQTRGFLKQIRKVYDRRRYRLRPQSRTLRSYTNPLSLTSAQLSELPPHILRNLEKSAQHSEQPLHFQPGASTQGWREVLTQLTADGTQILNTTTETIMVPDYTIPSNYMQLGRTLKYTIFFDCSTVVTTPGTVTLSNRWGGVAGTVLATSAAIAPKTTVSTTFSGWVEWYLTARAVPSAAASSYTMGRLWIGQVDPTSVTTITTYLQGVAIPSTAPAAVNIASNAANAWSPTVKFSVTTATTQLTAHLALLESTN